MTRSRKLRGNFALRRRYGTYVIENHFLTPIFILYIIIYIFLLYKFLKHTSPNIFPIIIVIF